MQRARAPHPLELLFLERAQDLGLQPERQVTNLVQEERSPVRHLEPSQLPPDGPGEGALLVTEQLAFKQPLGNGRAVDGDEWSVGPGAERVQRAREQLLAGAALPFEQHGGIGSGGPAQQLRDLPQLRILPDDPWGTAPLGQLFLEQDVFGKHPAPRDRALHDERQVVRIDRLGEEIHRAFLHRRDCVRNAAVRGHDHHLQFRVELPGRAKDAESVANGKREVGQDDRRPRPAQLFSRLGLVACVDHDVPLLFERVAEHTRRRIGVFDEKNRKGHG